MITIEQLEKENAELRASIRRIKCDISGMDQCNDMNSGYEPSLSCFQRSVQIVITNSNKLPVQHLSDIKADAQEEFISMMRDDLRKHIAKASGAVDADFLISLKFADRMIQE